jgi:uncharacterized membrane protein YhaH (DUF805 family)
MNARDGPSPARTIAPVDPERMSPIVLTIVIALAAVLGTAAWMDFKRRRLHDTRTSGDLGHERRRANLESKEKGARWSAGH